jgi:hypothetical protein
VPAARTSTPIGYAWLIDHFQIDPIPHFVESFATERGHRRTETEGSRLKEFYPQATVNLATVFDHLDFALKREGLHLELLRLILPGIAAVEMTAHVTKTPTGANARRLWFFYERFTDQMLAISNLLIGNYIELADPKLYYTRTLRGPGRKLARWRINFNLLGDVHFSPMVRRTAKLAEWEAANLQKRCETLIGEVPTEIFQRARRFLYAKETKTSYEIEREVPSQQRAERFMALLARAGEEEFLEKEGLVALQNAIVDPRFAATGWRTEQNYVGRSLGPGLEDVHLVTPRPEDLPDLMDRWLDVARHISQFPDLPPIAASDVVAWVFVYFHPFEDGNGRIHRFLIHHVLAKRRFGPAGVLLPVSAVMLGRPADYDASLEVFSRPLKERSEYILDAQARMTVTNFTGDHFRYIDCTAMAEALYSFLNETIEKELPGELAFLQFYDRARAAMRDVVDLPEITANLFLRLAHQNGGRLSKAQRGLAAFSRLTEEEITALEDAIASAQDKPLQKTE